MHQTWRVHLCLFCFVVVVPVCHGRQQQITHLIRLHPEDFNLFYKILISSWTKTHCCFRCWCWKQLRSDTSSPSHTDMTALTSLKKKQRKYDFPSCVNLWHKVILITCHSFINVLPLALRESESHWYVCQPCPLNLCVRHMIVPSRVSEICLKEQTRNSNSQF